MTSQRALGGRFTRFDVVIELALVTVVLSAALGSLRLVEHPPGVMVLGIFGACLAGHVAAAASERLHAPAPAPIAWGLLAVVLASIWMLVPGTTFWGLPTAATASQFADRIREASDILRTQPTPLRADPGIVLAFVLLAGGVAAGSRALYAIDRLASQRRVRPLVVLVPSFVLFCYTSIFSSDRARLLSTFVYLASATLFVVSAEAGLGTAASDRLSRLGRGVALGSAACLVALLTSAVPAVAGTDLRIFVHVYSNGAGAGNDGLTKGLALSDDLGATESAHSDAVAFVTTSPLPTFWQMGVLTSFDGTRWQPDPTTAALAAGNTPAPGTPAPPSLEQPVGPLFSATVTLESLASWLLPVPPGVTLVEPDTGNWAGPLPVVDSDVGVILKVPPSLDDRLKYEVVASSPDTLSELRQLSIAKGETVGESGSGQPGPDVSSPGDASASLRPYLSLPKLPSSVVSLAHRIVSGLTTPAARALALEEWFISGSFRYTLDPPPLHGRDPLTAFLFVDKAGFCQQFAGAYAALARIDGLPTRLAVGFTPGRPVGDDTYVVTAADAHVWPEVYLGPQIGWFALDPTPGDGSGVGATPGPVPSAGKAGQGRRSRPGATPTPTTVPAAAPTTVPSGSAASARSQSRNRPDASGRGTDVALAVGGLAVLVVGGIFFALFRRRGSRRSSRAGRRSRATFVLRRTRRAAHDGESPAINHAGVEVLQNWRRAAASFDRVGFGRWNNESPTEHAKRLRLSDTLVRDQPEALGAYETLSEMAARAAYSGVDTDDASAAASRSRASEVRRDLRRRRRADAHGPASRLRRGPASRL